MKIKVIILGDKAVGKTLLLSHLRHRRNKPMYIPTIGVDLFTYSKSGTTLQIWDTSGSPKFNAVTRSFLRGVSLCIIVYNSSRSCNAVDKYLSTIDMLCERDYRVVIVCVCSDADIVALGEAVANRNNVPFYQCNVFYRASGTQFWHDIIHRCETYVQLDGWKVDKDLPRAIIPIERSFWDQVCFWR